MQYFISRSHCFPVNSKVISNSICYGIMKKDEPEKLRELEESGEVHDLIYRTLVEQTDSPDKPILMLVREPVDRFISAISMNSMNADYVLDDLKNGGEWSMHPLFERQIDFANDTHGQPLTLFKYPEQLKDFCTAAGFEYPLPALNISQNEKIALTDAQKEAVAEYYAPDLELYRSL